MACNRDELRSRALALPPTIRSFGGRRAILPVDPESGGTWVAVSDAGVALTLLNGNPAIGKTPAGAPDEAPSPAAAPVSRGTIIPSLLPCPDAVAAARAAATIDPARHKPFRLVIADRESIFEVVSDGVTVRELRRSPEDLPLVFASSGLGDHLVQGPRREMFEKLLSEPGLGPVERQDAFHRLRLPDRPHASTCISRAEAHTVSHTVIEVHPVSVRLSYHPGAPDRAGPTHTLALDTGRTA